MKVNKKPAKKIYGFKGLFIAKKVQKLLLIFNCCKNGSKKY
jgi:hypothetical protein